MAAAQGLIARGNPVIEEHAQAREAKSYRRGKAEALQLVLAQRGLELDAPQLARVEACDDPELLDRWLRRALTATHADAIFLGQDDG